MLIKSLFYNKAFWLGDQSSCACEKFSQPWWLCFPLPRAIESINKRSMETQAGHDGTSGTRGDLHSDISVTNLGDSQKTLADGAVSFPGSNRASYSAVGSKSHGGVGGRDVSSSQYSVWGHHSSMGCQLKSGVGKKSPATLGKWHGSNSKNHWGKAESSNQCLRQWGTGQVRVNHKTDRECIVNVTPEYRM